MLRSFVAGLVAGLLMVLPAGAGDWTTTPAAARAGGPFVDGSKLTDEGLSYLTSLRTLPFTTNGPRIYVSEDGTGQMAIGNDANSGLDEDNPIATCTELLARIDTEEALQATVVLDTEGLLSCTATDFDFSFKDRGGEPDFVIPTLKIECIDPDVRCPITYGATNPTIAMFHLGSGGVFDDSRALIMLENIEYTCGSVGSDRPWVITDDGITLITLNVKAGSGCGTSGQPVFRAAQDGQQIHINAWIETEGNTIASVTESGRITFIGSGQTLGVNAASDSGMDAFVVAADVGGVTNSDSSPAEITVIGHQVVMDDATHGSANVVLLGSAASDTAAVSVFRAARSIIAGTLDTGAGICTLQMADVRVQNGTPYGLELYQSTVVQFCSVLGYTTSTGAAANALNRQTFRHNVIVVSTNNTTTNTGVYLESGSVNSASMYQSGSYTAVGNVLEEFSGTEANLLEIDGVTNATMALVDADRAGTLADVAANITSLWQDSENASVNSADQFNGTCDAGNFYYCACDVSGTPAACGTAANFIGVFDEFSLGARLPPGLVPGASGFVTQAKLRIRQIGAR